MIPKISKPKSQKETILKLWGKIFKVHTISRETQKALLYMLTTCIMLMIMLWNIAFIFAWFLGLK